MTAPTVILGPGLSAQPGTQPGTQPLRLVSLAAAVWLGAVLSAAGTILADGLGGSLGAYTLVTASGVALLLSVPRLRAARLTRQATATVPTTTTAT